MVRPMLRLWRILVVLFPQMWVERLLVPAVLLLLLELFLWYLADLTIRKRTIRSQRSTNLLMNACIRL